MEQDAQTWKVLDYFGISVNPDDEIWIKGATLYARDSNLRIKSFEFDDYKRLFLRLPRNIQRAARNALANDPRACMRYSIENNLGCWTCSEVIEKAPYENLRKAYNKILECNRTLGWICQTNMNDMANILNKPLPRSSWDGCESYIKYIDIC
jgi:hypothetical protein